MRDDHEVADEQDAPIEATVVAIGASAGGLDPIQSFFDKIPANTGATFVVVQHLSPDFQSLMPELLARHTKLPITRVDKSIAPIEPNHVYLIPAGGTLEIVDGALTTNPQIRDGTPKHPIDAFFKSMASFSRHRSIAIVLSGTGSDGSRGVCAVKEEGGIVMVQDPVEAGFDGMPRSALASNWVDFALTTNELADKVIDVLDLWRTGHFDLPKHMPVEFGLDFDFAEQIVQILWEHHGRDFRQYAPKTVRRRIARRLLLLQITEPRDYLELLRENATEADNLVQELLIGVTSLFRDPPAFERVAETLRELVAETTHPLRIWVPGCSSGDEAYSLAILIDEAIRASKQTRDFKVFATDIDERALARAADGHYDASIADHVGCTRIQNYFEANSGNRYTIRRALRNRVVFAKHDVATDPPFTRIDLVSCRNLLIYFRHQLQETVLQTLHFALRDGGTLFLGPSESLGSMSDAFEAISSRWRIYRKGEASRMPMHLNQHISDVARYGGRAPIRLWPTRRGEGDSSDFRRICETLVESCCDAAFVLDSSKRVVYAFGVPSRFAALGAGNPSLELRHLLPDQLRLALATGIQRLEDAESVRFTNISFAEQQKADFYVRRLPHASDLLDGYLVLLTATDDDSSTEAEQLDANAASAAQIAQLQDELQVTREHLQVTLEEAETANEELQSTNEELMASNEELQSTNEELQSVNEELYTVNAEHQDKIHELSGLTSDMEGLLQSTQVGTLFLDSELKIRKYTSALSAIVSILPSDVGRAFGDLSHSLVDIDIASLIVDVQTSGQALERRVRQRDGLTYQMRIMPYELESSEEDGLLITFADITEVHAGQLELARQTELFEELIDATRTAYWITTLDGMEVRYLSPVFGQLYGIERRDLEARPLHWLRRIRPEDRDRVVRALDNLENLNVDFRLKVADGEEPRFFKLRGRRLDSVTGEALIAGTLEDITESHLRALELESMLLRLEQQANNDPLTGLLNRRGLEKSLLIEIERCRRMGVRIVALLIDLDDFKAINDQLGHATGDVVLRQVAKSAAHHLRPMDSIVRIGGDEFLVLLPDTRLAEGMRVAERLRLAIMEAEIEASGRKVKISASIGLALVPTDVASVEEVVARVQRTLSMSKKAGKNQVRSDALQARSPGEDDAMPSVLELSEGDSLRTVGQPIVDMRDTSIIGYELLSRGPAGPFENPNDLFRASMDSNILTVMDLKCLRTCVSWADKFEPTGILHVNLFPSTLLETPPERLASLLDPKHDLSRYCIEISEQQFIGNPEYLAGPVKCLRDYGAKIAIDDVGFGRSCLEALIILEPEVIKIDRSFVTDVDKMVEKQRHLTRLINAAEGLGGEIVAEGIENAREASFVRDTGVRAGQGYFFGRPSPQLSGD